MDPRSPCIPPKTGYNTVDMKIEELDYSLPPELIAQYPETVRDRSRLLILNRNPRMMRHRLFYELPDYLAAGDLLVLNDTQVFPARLRGRKIEGGGIVEVLLIREVSPDRWEALIKPGKRVQPDIEIAFAGGELLGRVLYEDDPVRRREGIRIIELSALGSVREKIELHGQIPLPPYIKRTAAPSKGPLPGNCKAHPHPHDSDSQLLDAERYQTVYARNPGAVAAPTAGLHFTHELLGHIRTRGVCIEILTLHVGPGTFRPLRGELVEHHKLEPEYYHIGPGLAEAVRQTKRQGNRVISVGTTTTRALEAAAVGEGNIQAGPGQTDLFIFPGYRFRVVDALITNFHLPRSTLLALVYAFGGKGPVFEAYQKAIEKKYRFYSYGDAMLIV